MTQQEGDFSTDTEVSQDQIEVHWQHPRTELELPLLLVWLHPVRDQWAAVVDNGVASVVCHEWLADVSDDDSDERDIQNRAEEWGREETIPESVRQALLDYEGEYGPVTDVTNPGEPVQGEDADPDLESYHRTLDEFQECNTTNT